MRRSQRLLAQSKKSPNTQLSENFSEMSLVPQPNSGNQSARFGDQQEPSSGQPSSGQPSSGQPSSGHGKSSPEVGEPKRRKRTTSKKALSSSDPSKEEGPPERVWTVDDFEIGRPLGRGAFGRVYLARTKKEQYIVALKILFKKQLSDCKVEQNFRREIEINARLDHPYILRMYGFFWDDIKICLILEYAPNGELFKLLRQRGHFTEPEAASYVAELVDALIYCHTKKVIHRDIKPENLLLGPYGELKLADFGWSVHAPNTKRRTVCGTTDYLAPELVAKQSYDATIDIWCTGVLLYEFLFGSPPFETNPRNDAETHRRISACSFVVDPNFISKEPERLIRAMLKRSGADRMPLEVLRQDQWIVENRLEKTRVILPGDEDAENHSGRR